MLASALRGFVAAAFSSWICVASVGHASAQGLCPNGVLTGTSVLNSGWKEDAPLVCRKVTPDDLPAPHLGGANNGQINIPRPAGATPKAPPGFTVTRVYSDSNQPRLLHSAPNGDLFVSESAAGIVRVLRPNGSGGFSANSVFASGLNYPFGVAFYPYGGDPNYVYVAQRDRVVRFPYHAGDLVASGPAETIVPSLPSVGGHISRDVVFTKTKDTMLISVGSGSNDAQYGVSEKGRADILYAAPDGSGLSQYAWGIRNPVALGIEPRTGQIWTTVNERDDLGDNLVPDYVTRVLKGKFYGWPWYYIGDHVDPRHTSDARPVSRIVVPDLLLVSHSAPLGLSFYTGTKFPALYQQGAFVATHGSWNRSYRNGSKVVFVPANPDGTPSDTYQDFLTGFTVASSGTADGTGTWGRVVGVATGADGSLYVSDDLGYAIWRVDYAP